MGKQDMEHIKVILLLLTMCVLAGTIMFFSARFLLRNKIAEDKDLIVSRSDILKAVLAVGVLVGVVICESLGHRWAAVVLACMALCVKIVPVLWAFYAIRNNEE